ncbi:aminodeoxychorismate lyase [Paraglaciecola sp. 20A4]|uniref:aminodeoxychorismate lyase n=1 Tax=Paraglaciecola sp. 20A4 TaxID=2687288 RepID=UPI00140A6C88|nr:aminodeoxychorismate lyase [Paraglaciecola sp. 20A4]
MIVNGLPAEQIDIADRATQYGDGCFTTMAVKQGEIELWKAHLERLKHTCERLYIPFTDWDELSRSAFNCAQNETLAVLKILISRGSGGRGYSPIGADKPVYIITLHPMPTQYKCWQEIGIELNVSNITLAKQPLLAGLKHLNRLEQVFIKRELALDAFHDCIVLDTDNMIIESSVGNLFWFHDNAWFTPSLCFSGVEGVMRNHIIEHFKQNAIDFYLCREGLNTIQSAIEVFVCNSLMGVVPVNAIEFADGHRAYYRTDKTRQVQQEVTHHRV